MKWNKSQITPKFKLFNPMNNLELSYRKEQVDSANRKGKAIGSAIRSRQCFLITAKPQFGKVSVVKDKVCQSYK